MEQRQYQPTLYHTIPLKRSYSTKYSRSHGTKREN